MESKSIARSSKTAGPTMAEEIVDEDAERSEDVCPCISFLLSSTVQPTVARSPYARELRHTFSPVILGAH